MIVVVIIRVHDANKLRDCGQDNQYMEDLMRGPVDVEPAWAQAFREP